MRRVPSGRHFRPRSEAGQSLPAALIAPAVATLCINPFLSFVSSRALGTGVAQEHSMVSGMLQMLDRIQDLESA